MLKSHNTYRARHCVPSLQLDNALSRSAQDYANKLARMNQMVHSRTPNVGENLWMMSSSAKLNNIDGSTATANWYDEVKKYNFNRPGFSMGTGHFTQVVWKATQRLGVGFAFTSDRKGVYVVAQYSPAGNFQGQFPNNVLLGRC
uniref:Cysteine-rich secretory protein-2-like protein n=1 Tax=Adineta vaga TaxID=104782 RepID=B3G496_ADIVA|nr:cysteine-rich secretory protein-2-like protein [Adineta vaga]